MKYRAFQHSIQKAISVSRLRSSVKNFFKEILFSISGAEKYQSMLEYIAVSSHYLMGIGTGGSIDKSGEYILSEKLAQVHADHGGQLCVFDVGSNKGQFLTLILKGLAQVPVKIHAFEPARGTFELLRGTWGNCPNITLNNFGLGKAHGQFELYYSHEGAGTASLTKRRLEHLGTEMKYHESIQIETLDGYCASQGISRIDLLKLDVEGHELDVLTGAQRMFDENRIQMVSFEFGGCNIDTRTFFQDYWYFFKQHGMNHIYRITPNGFLAHISYYKEVYEQFRTTNFLVTKSQAFI